MENRDRKSPRRPEREAMSAWQAQAASWRSPERSFICCSVTFKAMTAEDLLLVRNAHQSTHRR